MSISLNEIYFIEQMAKFSMRADGRDCDCYRDVFVMSNTAPKSEFSAFAKLGRTSVEFELLQLQEGSDLTHNIITNIQSQDKIYAAHLELLSAFVPENHVLHVKLLTGGSGIINCAVSVLTYWKIDLKFISLGKVNSTWLADPSEEEEKASRSIYIKVYNKQIIKVFGFGCDLPEVLKN
ncbi:hypothetical protein SS50377_26556 [Spironucleus salmonicida]|uniref:Uncharacterized protein n=1 Tax=Spironucleus salmonicida TaxID=348837 RepID=V6LAD2_9EUKA|nr:hypothetical protein SS50377_26556 [Spironucleus salmonicida]|eukprot:EST41410.1 Hypothetical protein SS50377_19127 [Spironucleus salmonicida]